MPLTNITLSRPALASLFTVFRPNPDGEEPPTSGPLGPISNPAAGGRPPDDGPEISPHNPWGPIIDQAILAKLAPGDPIPWNTGSPGEQVGINPQPLPPRWVMLVTMAGAVREFLERGIIFVGGMEDVSKDMSMSHAKGLVSRMIDDCGNGKFFVWKPKKGGPIPEDGGPSNRGGEIIVFALALEQEATTTADSDLRGLLQEAAGILIQQGTDLLNGRSTTAS